MLCSAPDAMNAKVCDIQPRCESSPRQFPDFTVLPSFLSYLFWLPSFPMPLSHHCYRFRTSTFSLFLSRSFPFSSLESGNDNSLLGFFRQICHPSGSGVTSNGLDMLSPQDFTLAVPSAGKPPAQISPGLIPSPPSRLCSNVTSPDHLPQHSPFPLPCTFSFSHITFHHPTCCIFYYFVLAVLGLRFCARAFSSCGKRGPLLIAVRGPLTIAASLVVEHRLQMRRLSSCGSQA